MWYWQTMQGLLVLEDRHEGHSAPTKTTSTTKFVWIIDIFVKTRDGLNVSLKGPNLDEPFVP